MANTFKLKRRASGAAGTPPSLKSGELAWNMVDNIVYGGFGDNGSGAATSIVPVGGSGHFAGLASPALTGTPTAPTPATADNSTKIATTAMVQAAVGSAGGGDMLKSIYDSNDNGIVDNADAVPWGGVTGKPATYAPDAHAHVVGDVTDLQGALDVKAPLASPAFTGTPTAPTQANGNSTTRVATTAFVSDEIAAVMGAAPGVLNDLGEIAAAFNNDPNFAATMTTSLTGKLSVSNNLSDLGDAATARGNLGLGSMALQTASAVTITGGTIDGIILDGGTF